MNKLQAKIEALKISIGAIDSMHSSGNWDEDETRNLIYDDQESKKIEKELEALVNSLWKKYNKLVKKG